VCFYGTESDFDCHALPGDCWRRGVPAYQAEKEITAGRRRDGNAVLFPSADSIGVRKKMTEEKRMADTYEVKHAIYVGDKEILFAVDDRITHCPYMVCNCTWDNPLGIGCFSEAEGSADYLEMMEEFIARVSAQLEAVRAERNRLNIPLETLTIEHCVANDYRESIENKVVVIRPECLRPEYCTADKQLVLATGGFGSYANARGRAVYTVNLYSGKETRWNREDILGVVKPECLPDWAKERLKQIEAERKARQKKQEPER